MFGIKNEILIQTIVFIKFPSRRKWKEFIRGEPIEELG
jgi:hypothetical protein